MRIGLPVASEISAAASREPRVLALVVRDDAFEPVIGIERALAQEPSLVRLDAEPEVDDRVDVGMAGDELHHLGDRVAVSPPAKSMGLLRLHRGGSFSSIAARRSSGSDASSRPGARAIASAVTTPHPPAVVSTAVRGPRQRLRRERRRRLERLLDGRGARDPGLAAHAVEDAVVGREAAGVARRGALAAGGRAALDEHDRLAPRDGRETVEERSAVVDAFDVREADRGRVVVGVPVEVVGDGDRGRVAGRDRPAHADAGLHRPVLERRDEVAGLARDRDPTRRADTARRSARRGARASTPRPARSVRPAGCRARRRARPGRAARARPPRRPRRSPRS